MSFGFGVISNITHILYLLSIVILIQVIPFLVLILITGFIIKALFKIPEDVLETPRRLIDILLSSLLLTITSPVIAIISLLLRFNVASSPGPVFYKTGRCGLNGKEFNLYRFRTMVANADKIAKKLESKNIFAQPFFYIPVQDDPRLTKLGCVLKKTGLDELPVLMSVLKGDMSFFGPRPLRPKEIKVLEKILPGTNLEKIRLSVKPGFISLWDIYAYHPKTHHRFVLQKELNRKEWMNKDLIYIKHRSPILNTRIFLWYIPIMFERAFLPIDEVVTEKN